MIGTGKSQLLQGFFLTGTLFFLSCASIPSPSTSLQTDDPLWQRWLDEVVDVHLKNVPLGMLPRRAPFEGVQIRFSSADPTFTALAISLDASAITRGEALRRIASRYGFDIWFVQDVEGHPSHLIFGHRLPPPSVVKHAG